MRISKKQGLVLLSLLEKLSSINRLAHNGPAIGPIRQPAEKSGAQFLPRWRLRPHAKTVTTSRKAGNK